MALEKGVSPTAPTDLEFPKLLNKTDLVGVGGNSMSAKLWGSISESKLKMLPLRVWPDWRGLNKLATLSGSPRTKLLSLRPGANGLDGDPKE